MPLGTLQLRWPNLPDVKRRIVETFLVTLLLSYGLAAILPAQQNSEQNRASIVTLPAQQSSEQNGASILTIYRGTDAPQTCADRQSRLSASTQSIKISVADVEFSGENPLSTDARVQLLDRIKQLDLVVIQGDDSDWLAQIENPIREALQKQGYFRVLPKSTPYLIRAEAYERHYVINVQIEGGPQYRLDEIHFSGMTVFSAAELRAQFSLHHGDLFDVSEFWKGMKSMNRLYSGKGFIDMVPSPETNIDNESLLINVLFKVDEGKQYHVRTAELRGLDPKVEQTLKSQLEPGRVFDSVSLRNFVEEQKASLPTEVSLDDGIQVGRDVTNATVDVLVDFRPCPKT